MDSHSRARKTTGDRQRRRMKPAPGVKGWRRHLRSQMPERDRPGRITRNVRRLNLRDVDVRVNVERACLNKRWFSTAALAIGAALRESWRLGKPMAYYRCPVCPGYHLTSRVVTADTHPSGTPTRQARNTAGGRRAGHRARQRDRSPQAQPMRIHHIGRDEPSQPRVDADQNLSKEKP